MNIRDSILKEYYEQSIQGNLCLNKFNDISNAIGFKEHIIKMYYATPTQLNLCLIKEVLGKKILRLSLELGVLSDIYSSKEKVLKSNAIHCIKELEKIFKILQRLNQVDDDLLQYESFLLLKRYDEEIRMILEYKTE